METIQPANNIDELLALCPKNKTIIDNILIAWSKINSPLYKNILCSVSGGADSDIVLDICYRCDKDKKITYVWFDTGLEYQATKDHLKFLEEKYGIEIKRYKAKKSIPWSCKNEGQPFISKVVSEQVGRLQKYGFKWEDRPFEELAEEYPKCISSIKWWCNRYEGNSKFNIQRNKHLKEFMIQNPPTFKISQKCCKYAKKDIAHDVIKDIQADLNVYGIRKAEGGARAGAYKSCFSGKVGECDEYRPLFWYSNDDIKDYENAFGITHSLCYTKYGLNRTGCVGCPFGKNFEFELYVTQKYEPKLYNAANVIFKDSYEYTRKYRDFVLDMKEKEREKKLAEKQAKNKS